MRNLMIFPWLGLTLMLSAQRPVQQPMNLQRAQTVSLAGLNTMPREAWVQQDPADSIYKLARAALNKGEFKRAAELFHRISERYQTSAYAADALYWEAFALYRVSGTDNLERAEELLVEQRERFPKAGTIGDARVLRERVRGELARLGDAQKAQDVTVTAGQASKACPNADDDDDVRATALNALLQMDSEQAIPILKTVLARRDKCSESLRSKAVFLVAQKRNAETEDLLMNVVRTDPSEEVREQAVFWLSQVPGEKALSLLEQILKTSKDEAILEKAIFAVSQHSSTRANTILRSYATDANAPVDLRDKAIFWIGQKGGIENINFLKTLFDQLTNEDLKEKVLFSISQRGRGEGADKWLMEVATNAKQDIEIRKKALFWAGQSGSPMEGLVELYAKMTDEEMKEQLIFVYSQRRESAAIDKLIDIAKNEKNVELRKKALFWLGQSKDPRASKLLLDIINQ